MNKLLPLPIIFVACWGCSSGAGTEKFQNNRNNIVNVGEKVKEINTRDVYIGYNSYPQLVVDYLIIGDYISHDKLLHLFNKNGFNHAVSIADKGKGPGEIANLGRIVADDAHRKFYVTDHGKQVVFSYDLDSVLTDPAYMPSVKMRINESRFPIEYRYIHDTLCIGWVMTPIGNSDFSASTAKWNMNTGIIKLMKYTHPDIEKKRISVAVSVEQGVYVECYHHHDLMTICTLDGELKYNIYGNKWDSRKTNSVSYYGGVTFCNDKIVVLYSSGDDRFPEKTKFKYPTKFLVFDAEGNYIKTLETGYEIINFCYDQENNRLILNLNEEMQFAYLNLDGLIE